MSTGTVLQLTEQTFDQQIAQGLTLVDFWAEWCGPCKVLNPVMDQLAAEFGGRVQVAKVDADQNPRIPAKVGVRGLPTVMLFKDGQPVDLFAGTSPGKIRDMLERVL